MHIHIHTKYIYTETQTNLNAHPYLNNPVVKKRINCSFLCQKEASSSYSSNLIFNLRRNKGKVFFSNSCR